MSAEPDDQVPEPPEGEFVGAKPFDELTDEELDAADREAGAGKYAKESS